MFKSILLAVDSSRYSEVCTRYALEYAKLLGAKITGGGSGGTVAVLVRNEACRLLRDIMRDYRQRTGLSPLLLTGSTAGATRWGTRTI